MSNLEIGSISVPKGEKANGVFKIGEFPDSSPINVPVLVVNGMGEGPTLWVQSAIHGNEVCGGIAAHKVANELDPANVNGVFIGVPAANITAFWSQTRGSPFEKLAHLDMNRVFPGKPDGTLTEQFAYAIFTQIKTHANYLIDFHSGSSPKTKWTLYPKLDNDASRESEKLAKYFGFSPILPLEAGLLSTSLFALAARDLGIPAIIPEAGSKNVTYDHNMVQQSVNGIKNVMKYLNMIPGEPILADKYYILKNWTWMRVPKGGFVRVLVDIDDLVSQGQHIASIIDIYGNEQAKIVSPLNGIILALNPGPLVFPGDSFFQLAEIDTEE